MLCNPASDAQCSLLGQQSRTPVADARIRTSCTTRHPTCTALYGRCDFRVDERGEVYLLEINPNCGVLYPPGLHGSADYILSLDPTGGSGHTNTGACVLAHGVFSVCTDRYSTAQRTACCHRAPGFGVGLHRNAGAAPSRRQRLCVTVHTTLSVEWHGK